METKIVKRTVEYGTEDYKKMVELRNDVLLAPIGLPYYEEVLKNDSESIHCVSFDGKEAIGCCVLTDLGDGLAQLRQMAVSDKWQRKGIGEDLIAFAEYVAEEHGFDEIMLHARRVAENFYLRNGYSFVGEEFLEVEIPHFEMRKKL